MTEIRDLRALEDAELVRLAQNGDGDACELLLKRYKNLVKAKSKSYFLVGANTDDLIQEGMIGLYKAIRDFSPSKLETPENGEKKAVFSAFADMCVKRQIITAIKAATRQKHIPLNSYVSLSQPAFDSDSEKTFEDTLPNETVSDPENILIGRESYEDLVDRIKNSLSRLEMSVLREYLKGKSYSEIGETLGKPIKSIDNALQRIKNKLGAELETGQS